MLIRFPTPLRRGDTVAVTSPSSGVPEAMKPRLAVAIEAIRDHGYQVVVGDCMAGETHVSAPASERARELTTFLTDPRIRAVIPPWGGETAIDLLPLLDWDAIGRATPTWFIGFSDMSTIITPLSMLTGIATVHGNNLMDTPYRSAGGLTNWLEICRLPQGSAFTQSSPGRFRSSGWDDYIANPGVAAMSLDSEGGWRRLGGDQGPVTVHGRLIGGCVDTIAPLAGTGYGDASRLAQQYAADVGLIVYVEVAEIDAYATCRALHGMRLAGFFDHANAILVGRTLAPDSPSLSQDEAMLDALGSLDVPIVADVDCGHVQPYMPLVNGALAEVRFEEDRGTLTQTLA